MCYSCVTSHTLGKGAFISSWLSLNAALGYKADTTSLICLQPIWTCPPAQDQATETLLDLHSEVV